MLRLKDTRHAHTGAFLTSAIKLAEYYGFEHLDGALERAQKKMSSPRAISPRGTIALARRDEKYPLCKRKPADIPCVAY